MTNIFTYSGTFILGLLHALEPGHGKSILATFSIKDAKFKIFASLILSLFVSHFLVLVLFAWGLQALASIEALESYSNYLQLLSPVLVIAFGVYLFFKAKNHRQTKTGCSCGHNHSHDVISNIKTASITGLITGIMPCPTAIAPLLIAGADQGFNHTLVHIFVYVVGMTLALFSFTGILMVAKSFFQGSLDRMEEKINLNMLTAFIMIGIGVVYLVINSSSFGHHHHV